MGGFIRSLYLPKKAFVDYVVIDPQTKSCTDEILVRNCTYFRPLLYGLVFKIMTLGFGTLQIRCKTTYYQFSMARSHEEGFKMEDHVLSKQDYRARLEQQRILYSTAQVPDYVVADICSPDNVRYKTKITASIIALVLSLICSLFVFLNPADLLVAIPLWWWYSVTLTNLKDAKIKKELYDRYLKEHPELTSPQGRGVIEVSESTQESESVTQKHLTKEVIRQDLHLQKHTLGEYLTQALLVALMILLVCLGRPAILLMGIFLLFNLNSMVFDDIQRSRLKYEVLERKVLNKTIDETDDTTIYRLWFADANYKNQIAIGSSPDVLSSTDIGDEYYIVILKGDETPCLCYRKSEWTL